MSKITFARVFIRAQFKLGDDICIKTSPSHYHNLTTDETGTLHGTRKVEAVPFVAPIKTRKQGFVGVVKKGTVTVKKSADEVKHEADVPKESFREIVASHGAKKFAGTDAISIALLTLGGIV